MIKLERGKRPKELTQEVCDELTKLYLENRDKDVWNCSKVKQPLKDALLDMTHGKCAYCECQLRIESKDVTIDHFLPKSDYPHMVLKWENLLPSCLRCNRDKSDYSEKIVNPCIDNPQEYLALNKKDRYRLQGIDKGGVGKNTIISIKLNDIVRVMVPRMEEWEGIHQSLEWIWEDLKENGYKIKYKNRIEVLLQNCKRENTYAAVKASNMLDDDCYLQIRQYMQNEDKWTDRLQELEDELREIALQFI